MPSKEFRIILASQQLCIQIRLRQRLTPRDFISCCAVSEHAFLSETNTPAFTPFLSSRKTHKVCIGQDACKYSYGQLEHHHVVVSYRQKQYETALSQPGKSFHLTTIFPELGNNRILLYLQLKTVILKHGFIIREQAFELICHLTSHKYAKSIHELLN